MPLLGKKLFKSVSPLLNAKPGEKIYAIEHTQEQFRSKDEYEKRLAHYQERVWTCQCTGHINLPHEEAWRSEKENYELLQRKFPEYFEKPVLELVHHSTEILDNVVDMSWTKLQQAFVLNEKVALKVKAHGKTLYGVVVKVDATLPVDYMGPSNCNSPSSDKENNATVNSAEDSDDDDDDDGAFASSPKKWTPPKLLPYKYNLHICDTEKVISGVPAADIHRITRTPSKDLVKLFIRSFALRHGSQNSGPWVVVESQAKKLGLIGKFASLFLSPAKTPGKTEAASKKRKAGSKTPTGSAPKKARLEKTPSSGKKKEGKETKKNDSQEGTPKKRGRPPKDADGKEKTPKLDQLPKKNVQPLKEKVDSSVKNTPTKSTPKGTSKSTPKKTKSPQKTPKKSATPRKVKDVSSEDSDNSNIALSKIKLSPKLVIKRLDDSPKKALSSVKKEKTLADVKRKLCVKKDTSAKKSEKAAKKKDKSAKKGTLGKGAKKGGMKQMTLFDMKKKPKGSTPKKNLEKSPKKSPRKQPSPYKLPPLAARLQKAMQRDNKPVYHQLLARCAKELPARERQRLPPELKQVVNQKWERYEEKKKIEKMTPEEREEYMKKKRIELTAKMRKQKAEQNRKYEDTELDLKPLPSPKLVPTPDGFANELFGDVAMVIQFISCYQGLFLKDDEVKISAEKLMAALAGSEQEQGLLNRVLAILLQALLQDAIAEDYKELDLQLASLSVSPYAVSELIRLCLRKHDANTMTAEGDNESTESEDILQEDTDVPEYLIEQLESVDLHTFSPEDKLMVLTGLCQRIMSSYSVQDYMMQKQTDASSLWKQKIKGLKEKNDKLKEEKQLKKEMKKEKKGQKSPLKPEKDVANEKDKRLTINDFYGNASVVKEEEQSDDLATTVKRRRLNASKVKEEKDARAQEVRLQRDRDYEEQQRLYNQELFEKQFTDGIQTAKNVFRLTPLGTDRNHSKYWLLRGATPAIYVEKGWASNDITYSVRAPGKTSYDSDSELDSDESGVIKKGRPSRAEIREAERTIPHIGQNLWFMYNTQSELNELVAALHTLGARESVLLAEINNVMPVIETLLSSNAKVKKQESTEDEEYLGLVKGFREELQDTEMRLRAGGLGGVDKFTDWEKRLKIAQSIEDFSSCLLETQAHVFDKFLKGMMVPVKVKKVKEEAKVEDKKKMETDDNEDCFEFVKKGIQMWTDAVNCCPTFSRLHFLISVLDSCIKWDKSAADAKCKICRKKGDDDDVLLCDDCNQAFHMFCLRPALTEVPTGDWFCPVCIPVTKRKCSRNRNYRELANISSDEEENGENAESADDEGDIEIQHEENCTMCGGDEGLFYCSTCPSAFHIDCHQPPLRREPRSCWKCNQCVTGVRIKSSRPQRAAAANRKRFTKKDLESSSEEEVSSSEEEGDSSEEKEEDAPPATVPRSSRGSSSTRRGSTASRGSVGRRSTSARRGGNSVGRKTAPSRTTPRSAGRSRKQQEVKSSSSEDNESASAESDEASEEEQSSEEEDRQKAYENEQKVMKNIVGRLMRHKHAWPFYEAVNKDEVPDYYAVVKNPVDLSTIRSHIENREYDSAKPFLSEIALLFDNAELYNTPESEVGRLITPFENFFKDLYHKQLSSYPYRRDFENPEIFEDHAYTASPHKK